MSPLRFLVVGLLGLLPAEFAAAQGAETELVVQSTDFESADGAANIVLLSDPQAFQEMMDAKGRPLDKEKFAGRLTVAVAPIENGAAAARFTNLTPGEYAVVVFHDANGNQQLDRKKSFVGSVPAEDVGMSNDYRFSFPPRPPSWNDLKFSVQPGANKIALKMGVMRR